MFENFSSSGRGSSLVGVLFAILVLVGLGGIAIAVFNDRGSGGGLKAKMSRNEVDIRLMKNSLQGLKEKLTVVNHFQQLNLKVTAGERHLNQAIAETSELKQQRAGALKGLEAQKAAFNQYRNQYRTTERGLAKGQKIDLSSTKGTDYKDVTILSITATHLRIHTSTGPKGIPFYDLPAQVQDRFQFGEDESQQNRKKAVDEERGTQIAEARMVLEADTRGKKMAARAARIKFLPAEIEKFSIIAAKKSAFSGNYALKALEHETDSKDARGISQSKMHQNLAKIDRAKANRYAREAKEAQKKSDDLNRELEGYTR